MFVLLIFFSLHGEPQRQEIPQPDYLTCLREKTLWLGAKDRLQAKEAYCVVRAQ